jgi:hypothetical protein
MVDSDLAMVFTSSDERSEGFRKMERIDLVQSYVAVLQSV